MKTKNIFLLLTTLIIATAIFSVAQTKSPLDDDYVEEKLPKSIDTKRFKAQESIIITAGYRYPKGWVFSKMEDNKKQKLLIGSYSGETMNKTVAVDNKFYNWLSSSVKLVERDLIKENAITVAALCPDYLTVSRLVAGKPRDDRFYCMGTLTNTTNEHLNHLFERLDLAVQNYNEWYKTASN